jgi:uncharacterized protein (DUF488 family)
LTYLLTFGYYNKSVYSLKKWVNPNTTVIDIRVDPRSHTMSWDSESLENILGDAYCHIPELGNLNYGTKKPLYIKDIEAGWMKLAKIMEKNNAILICGCRDCWTCHRHYIAEYYRKQTGRDWCEIGSPRDDPQKEPLKNMETNYETISLF